MTRDAAPPSSPLQVASWWEKSVRAVPDVGRRDLMKALLAGGAATAGLAALYVAAERVVARDALTVQRALGWSFGAVDEPLVFDGDCEAPYDRAVLGALVSTLRPSEPSHRPDYVPTLLEAPSARPTDAELEETVIALADALVPIHTAAMDRAHGLGKRLAARLESRTDTLVLVDLPGPESVAFAAGMARTFDVVLGFDNWPHPRGAVASHLALGAIVYYHPLLVRVAAERLSGAPAVIAIDDGRLDAEDGRLERFDNRYVARVPTAARLRELRVSRVAYVVRGDDVLREQDDLNADFVAWARSGIAVRLVSLDALEGESGELGVALSATPRPTVFSWASGARVRPEGFAEVPLVLTAATGRATGLLLGGGLMGCCAGDDSSWGRGGYPGG